MRLVVGKPWTTIIIIINNDNIMCTRKLETATTVNTVLSVFSFSACLVFSTEIIYSNGLTSKWKFTPAITLNNSIYNTGIRRLSRARIKTCVHKFKNIYDMHFGVSQKTIIFKMVYLNNFYITNIGIYLKNISDCYYYTNKWNRPI